MRFTKPAWVAHRDSVMRDQTKPLSIFSVHVHPDGSRIATGGLDAKVRIWSTKPILNHASETSGRPPKSLCTLTMHTGPVLTVRWAHSGRWLASGSDDEIVMIWDLDPTAKGKVWGTDEVNVEGWKPLKRLPGHESDVTDLAWSPGDRYLASVGLDSQVLIWCGFTLERLHKISQHQGFVKGVCWDPVGEFLATQSDDRSVKIWRTIDWQMEAEVRKPFEDSPGTFFRRLSWSPDGAHITASNATNNKGYVFIAAVITRNSWTSEISLVGHENTVEVAAYNPHIFLRDPALPVQTSNICSVVALGADDRSVSVWQTKSARPLIVAKEVFDRQIMDLSWSWDGLTLYAVSSDGTMGVFSFDPDELEGIAPHAAQEQYLHKFGFIPPPLPEGYSHPVPPHLDSKDSVAATRITPPPSPSRAPSVQLHTDFGASANGAEYVHKLVAKRKNKKRIQSSFIGSLGSSIPSAANVNEVAKAVPPPSAAVPSASVGRVTFDDLGAEPQYSGDMDVDLGEVQITSLSTTGAVGKRKASAADLGDERVASRPRTLGGDRVPPPVSVRQLAPGGAGTSAFGFGASDGITGNRLAVPPLLSYLTTAAEGSEDTFEGRNPEDAGETEVMLVSGKQTLWLDYLPAPALALVATSFFCAVAMQDGAVNVYSHTGRRLMPTLNLGSPCSIFKGSKTSLMLLTTSGQLHVWNVKKQTAIFPPVSVAPIIGTSPNTTIISAAVRPNGAPVIHVSTDVAYSYDPMLSVWVKLSESWWAEGSDAWQGRQRANSQQAARGAVATVEGAISDRLPVSDAGKARPQWWETALTLGHLETRLHAARALESPQEYKQALVLYAKKIADEGFRAKGEELVKELFGPVYWRPGRDDSWSPTTLGLSKRDLLRDVLAVFARSKTLTKLALDWQDMLKKASTEE